MINSRYEKYRRNFQRIAPSWSSKLINIEKRTGNNSRKTNKKSKNLKQQCISNTHTTTSSQKTINKNEQSIDKKQLLNSDKENALQLALSNDRKGIMTYEEFKTDLDKEMSLLYIRHSSFFLDTSDIIMSDEIIENSIGYSSSIIKENEYFMSYNNNTFINITSQMDRELNKTIEITHFKTNLIYPSELIMK